jgi:hypothetical protein
MKITGINTYQQFASTSQMSAATSSATSKTSGGNDKESLEVQQQVQRLKAVEAKVKAHEAAHKAAGGAMTGAVTYQYTTGPDGKRYITGGEVSISLSRGSTPEQTISNMEQVIRAALAPADPSPQDRAVAGQATAIEQQARQEKTTEKNKEANEKKQQNAASETGSPKAASPAQAAAYQKNAAAPEPVISIFA